MAMIYFGLFMVGLAIYDITNIKKKTENSLVAYILLAIVATGLGLFYFQDTYKPSLCFVILKLFGMNF